MKKSLIVLSFTFILSTCIGQQTNNFIPSFKESTKTTHKIPDGQEYTFGYLEVLENRNKPQGNKVNLPVYIFKSRNKNKKKDPIIYTVGGPGSSTMSSAKYMKYYKYLDDRDFILFEQRGTQFAKPSLDCPEWSEVIYRSNLPDFNKKRKDSLLENAAFKCKKKLIGKNIDLNSYTTNVIAADIEDLRKVLGIKKYNLLTISYSTKISQVLLRDYPNAIRSAVMDSPLPLEVNYDEESVENLLEVLDKLLSDCELDKKCNNYFPNIKKRFFNYLKEKTKNPLMVVIENPNNAKLETFYFKGKDFLTVFTTASASNISNVPFEIEKLLNNDLSTLKKQLAYLFRKPNEFKGYGLGMRLTVWCAEEYPFASKKIILSETNKYPQTKGLSPAVFESSICEIWGVKSVNKIENDPIKTSIPVLMINGEYDNETPVKWATSMKTNLSNSYQLIFDGWTHTPTTNWSNQCAMKAANDFFNNPKKQPTSKCIEEIKKIEFKTK